MNLKNNASDNKKYFSISEVSALTSISLHKLRYIEKSSQIEVVKIRSRRYYTVETIEQIRKLLPLGVTANNQLDANQEAISKIDSLIRKFTKLEKKILKPVN